MGGIIGTVLLGIFTSGYTFVFTYVMLMAINFVTPVNVSEEDESLDMTIHREIAYDMDFA